jgi:hypothetical protein
MFNPNTLNHIDIDAQNTLFDWPSDLALQDFPCIVIKEGKKFVVFEAEKVADIDKMITDKVDSKYDK